MAACAGWPSPRSSARRKWAASTLLGRQWTLPWRPRLASYRLGPRLGYYGVIDERFDAGLIAALADAHPEWQLVLVGPVVKIDPASLPQLSLIHI